MDPAGGGTGRPLPKAAGPVVVLAVVANLRGAFRGQAGEKGGDGGFAGIDSKTTVAPQFRDSCQLPGGDRGVGGVMQLAE